MLGATTALRPTLLNFRSASVATKVVATAATKNSARPPIAAPSLQFATTPPYERRHDEDDERRQHRQQQQQQQQQHLNYRLYHSEHDDRRRQRSGRMTPRRHDASIIVFRPYHSSAVADRAGPSLALGFGALALAAKAGQLSVRAFREWRDSLPEESPEAAAPEKNKSAGGAEEGNSRAKGARSGSEDASSTTAGGEGGGDKGKAAGESGGDGRRENFFAKFFNVGVGSKYYEGGFEDKMTRREAALILGVRESSTTKRIKEAHRKLLILNHPDTGGSTYLSGKINEAKELLLKGKRDA